jgi:4-aminobutyrate aminotransferase-like enzyme
MEREQLCEHSLAKGRVLATALKELQKTHSLIGDVRGLGLMVGVELVRDAAKTPAPQEAAKLRAALREKGFLIGVGGTYGNVLRFQPPLVVTDQDIHAVVKALDETIRTL